MTTYKGIKGFNVEVLAADPSNLTAGQVWYNTTSNTLKGYGATAGTGAWTSGGAYPAAQDPGGAAGTPTAALGWGGYSTVYLGTTNTYDGTSWTATPASLNDIRAWGSGAGTQTNALMAGGDGPSGNRGAKTESYNGTSWTVESDLGLGRDYPFGLGTGTAYICTAGRAPGPSSAVLVCESWNGSTWTEVNNINAGRKYGASTGISTAGMAAGGNNSGGGVPVTSATEIWDGTCWTEVNNMVQGRDYGGGAGTTTSALFFAGAHPPSSPTNTDSTEQWNGTSWTEVANLATARSYVNQYGASQVSTTALCIGGGSPAAKVNLTEEWTTAAGPDSVLTFTAT